MKNKLSPNSNLLWESSRMMLPEHKALLRQHEVEKVKEEKPDYDEQLLESFAYTIGQAYNKKRAVELTYYEEGHFKAEVGVITSVDFERKVIQLSTESNRAEYNLLSLTSIELN